jgi:polysaccharide export outer membrane protein
LSGERGFIKKVGWAIFLIAMPFLFSYCAIQERDMGKGALIIRALPKETPSEFVLGPEDTLEILVWRNPDLTRPALIRPDGKITLPLIGEVQAAGLTPGQLAETIKGRLKEFYKEQPNVFVSVTAINSFTVFILGEVKAPGKYLLRRETSLLHAISLAGGFGTYANTNNILLIRKKGSIETRMSVRYPDIINGQHPEMNLMLQPGDTLIIP